MFDLHLKKIEIRGFKSFADKIEIEFEEGITAIVGPNGSGKSNISDAIRWALGEQSVKTLRGSKMEDIIFSGTDKRRALGYAEVSIIFDNKDGAIPIDYQEVAITRRMFRSGESEYYLNKTSCRLKDIREIFMDTGVGKDGYSIVGQGKVDEILSSRPEDRRNIFEEAAGIVKYKSKKEEAEKKLEKTQDNLIRIKDIIGELEKQTESLKEQSEKANTFLRLSNRLKELEVNLYIRDINRIGKELKLIDEEKINLTIQMDEKLREREKIESQFNLLKVKIEDMDGSIDRIQNEKIELLNQLNENKNQIKLLEEKHKFYIKDVDRLEREIGELKWNHENLSKEKRNLQQELKEKNKLLQALKDEFNQKNMELNKLNEKIKAEENTIEEEKDKVIVSYNGITDVKSKINNLLSFRENIDKRVHQIEKEIHSLLMGKEQDLQSLREIKELEVKKKEKLIDYNKFVANLRLKDDNYKEQLDHLYNRLNDSKVELQGKISNYNLLKNMQDDYDGYYKSVKNLMQACKRDEGLEGRLIGVVADIIRVEERYEKAIDVGLGGNLQNVVTFNEEDAKFIIEYLRKNNLGRVTFLPLSTIKGNPIDISPKDREDLNILGLGSEVVSYDERYKNIIEYLLGRTIVVKDLDDATLVAKRFNYRFRIVTLEGDIINPGGSMTGGSMARTSGNLLNRGYRLEKLKKEINTLSKIQRDLEQEKTYIKHKLEDNINELNKYKEELQSLNIEIIRLENEKANFNSQVEKNQESFIKYEDEINRLNIELIEIEEDKKALDKQLRYLMEENEKIKNNVKDFMQQFESVKIVRDQLMKEVTDMRIEINLLENKLIDNEEKVLGIENEISNLKVLQGEKKEELTNIKGKIVNIGTLVDSKERDIVKLSQLEGEKDVSLNLLREEKTEAMKDYYLQQSQLKEINEKLNRLEKSKTKYEVKEAKYDVQLDNINKRLAEDYELLFDDAMKLWIEIDDLDKAVLEVNELKDEIKDLGTVNLNSIDEYKVTGERLQFIIKQHDDLLAAKADLQKVINDMEMKMKEQFLYSFNKINENFNKVFSVLFDGGKADLILEDEEDILSCGIEVKAQPPGKKLQNLSLLSGGEKSLTAVALLFAILQTKPTPFCILDEIDAALDEANINRYTNYLKSLSHDTQFIMITHRKSTMEIADILYGVTMEEEGVSKIVSVKLTDDLDEIAS
ncbi:chromosome segregation protein SMC [Clostridium sp. Cult3]|nr:chromosome segregation protein SMC [Clostridium sp. Cult3]